MRYVNGHGQFVGQFLQLDLPQPTSTGITPTTVGGDEQALGFAVSFAPHFVPPFPDRIDGESGRVTTHPDADPTLVDLHIVYTIGRNFSCLSTKSWTLTTGASPLG